MAEEIKNTINTVDEWFEHHLSTKDFNKISESIVEICKLIMSCEEFQWKMSVQDEKLIFSNNIVSLCRNVVDDIDAEEVLDMLRHKENDRYKSLFKKKFTDFKMSALNRKCNGPCGYALCPKHFLALMIWLSEKNRLDDYLSKKDIIPGFFLFDWKLKDGVKNVSETTYKMAKAIFDARLVNIQPVLSDNKFIRFYSLVRCIHCNSYQTVSERISEFNGQSDFEDHSDIKRYPTTELWDGACNTLQCRNYGCPIHVAAYLEYMRRTGRWQEVEDDRVYYEEHKDEIEKQAKDLFDKEMKNLLENKTTPQAVAEFNSLTKKIENIESLVNYVSNKYSSSLYCTIEVEDGLDKNAILNAISNALSINGHLTEDNNTTKIKQISLSKLMGKYPYENAEVASNVLYVVNELDEFINQVKGSEHIRVKKVFDKLFTTPRKGKFIVLVGTHDELEILFDFDSKMRYLYKNLKVTIKALINDELFKLYIQNLDTLIADVVRSDQTGNIRKAFDDFVTNNRNVIPFKNAELAAFAAQYANARGEFVLPPSVYKKQTLEESLEQIVGLESVKSKMKMLENYTLFLNKAKSMDLKVPEQNLHMIFTGNPGTGKTTIARIMAQMLFDVGLIKHNKLIEVDRKDLVAQYTGQTAPKTNEVIQKALGGVLFIDEAYSLQGKAKDSFGAEAIATLIKAMEDKKGELVVIFAGYKDDMKIFVDSNAGIKSRIGYTFDFEDYTVSELIQILKKKLSKMGFSISKNALAEVEKISNIYVRRKNFGNGRYVDKLIQEILIKHSQATSGDISVISVNDIPTIEELNNEVSEKSDFKLKFENIIGLTDLKKQVTEFAEYVQYQKKAASSGVKLPNNNMHMIFTGNPGTGKTTVARLIARMLFDMDIIHENKLIEVDRKDLIAEYIGQTAPKTAAVIEKAMGGILFIDEAYALTPKDSFRDFGSEAVATLIKAMEDHKDNLIIIFAGYKDEMKTFIDSNPGVASRIGYNFHFEDYTPEELTQIYMLKMKNNGFQLSPTVEPAILKICKYFHRVENLGNGRFVDKLIQTTIMNQAKANKKNLSLIEEDVIPTIKEVTASLTSTSSIMDASHITEASLKKTATHEIGHAYLRYKLMNDPQIVKITINAEGSGTLGYVRYKADTSLTQSKQKLLDQITTILAGMASEDVFIGTFENGNGSDLEKATNIALSMVTRHGMSDLGLVYMRNAKLDDRKVFDAVNKILMDCLSEAKRILTENKEEVTKLIDVLLTEKELTGEQFMELVKENDK